MGDWVIADDPTTPGGVAPKQVMNTFVRRTEALVDLYVDGELISTTGEHPLWVADKGWVEAKDLQVGDLLQTDEETFVDVDRIEKRVGDFEVYNFDVEGFSTYFVSDLGVLVHNAGYGQNSVSFDEAIERAEQFLSKNLPMEVKEGPTGIQIIQNFTNSKGERITRRVGFDVDPNSSHVKKYGPHLNLQTQINGKPVTTGPLANPHTPIDSSTIRQGDY